MVGTSRSAGAPLRALVNLVGGYAGGGAIVCVSSRAALAPFPGAAGYVTAKAAVLAFVQAVAVEYRRDRVRCNRSCRASSTPPATGPPSLPPTRPLGAPAEVAAAIRFLCSDASRPTSGAAVPVYGQA